MELTIAVVVLAAWGLMKRRQVLKDLFRYGCIHRRTTWPNRDEEGAYVRCLNCAARIARPQWDEA